jgi:hypothetical protein
MFNSVMTFRSVPLFMILAFEMLSASMFFRRNSSEQTVMIRQSMRRSSACSSFAERRVRLRRFVSSSVSSVPSTTSSSTAVPRCANVIVAFFECSGAVAWWVTDSSLGVAAVAGEFSLPPVIMLRLSQEDIEAREVVPERKGCVPFPTWNLTVPMHTPWRSRTSSQAAIGPHWSSRHRRSVPVPCTVSLKSEIVLGRNASERR